MIYIIQPDGNIDTTDSITIKDDELHYICNGHPVVVDLSYVKVIKTEAFIMSPILHS